MQLPSSLAMYLFLSLSLLFSVEGSTHVPSHVNVGALLPNATPDQKCWSTVSYFSAILMAINDINNKTDGYFDELLPHTELRPVFRSPRALFNLAVGYALELVKIDSGTGVMATVGPYAAKGVYGTAPVFIDNGGIPMVGFNERVSLLGASRTYPNHMRIVPGMYVDGRPIASVVSKFFHWEKVSVFYSNDEFAYSANFFQAYADDLGLTVLSAHSFHPSEFDMSKIIESAKAAGSRIFILLMSINDANTLLRQGTAAGLFHEGTQLIGGEPLNDLTTWKKSTGLSDLDLANLLKGFVTVKYQATAPPSPAVSDFITRWRAQSSTTGTLDGDGNMMCNAATDYYGDFKVYEFLPTGSSIPVCCGVNYAASSPDGSDLVDEMIAYDATITIARGLHHLLYVNQSVDTPTPSLLHKTILNDIRFEGLSGPISFSSRFKDYDMDVGGRDTGLNYKILNFQYSTSSTTDISSTTSLKMIPFTTWNSETGFDLCPGQTEAGFSSSCHNLIFNTKTEVDPPRDSPTPVVELMPNSFKSILRALAGVCLGWILLDGIVMYCFRSRRLVKMSQPNLTYLVLFGGVVSMIRVILSTLELTLSICQGIFWTSHVGFLLIFCTLLVRAWRVSAITSSLKRVSFGESKSLKLIGLFVGVGVLDVLLESILTGMHVEIVKVESDQFDNINQLKCEYQEGYGILGLYLYEGLILAFGLYFCWTIRKVNVSVCDVSTILQASLTVIGAVILVFTVIYSVEFEPIMRQFLVALSISVTIGRVIWVLDSQLMYLVLLGYDLDKSLILQHQSWSILSAMRSVFSSSNSSKKHKIGIDETTETISATSPTSQSHSKRFSSEKEQSLARYAKEKNQNELTDELCRAQNELVMIQHYIQSLENMRFAADNADDLSTSSGADNSGHNRYHPDGPAGDGGGIPEAEIETGGEEGGVKVVSPI